MNTTKTDIKALVNSGYDVATTVALQWSFLMLLVAAGM